MRTFILKCDECDEIVAAGPSMQPGLIGDCSTHGARKANAQLVFQGSFAGKPEKFIEWCRKQVASGAAKPWDWQAEQAEQSEVLPPIA